MKRQKELSSRQWKLYSWLKKQKDYKTLRDVMIETGLYGDNHDVYNSSGGRALRKDITALRRSNVIQYTILGSTKKGIKIATKKEYIEYSKRKWQEIERKIKLQKIQDKKAGLDGQFRIVFGQEKPVIEAFREGVANG